MKPSALIKNNPFSRVNLLLIIRIFSKQILKYPVDLFAEFASIKSEYGKNIQIALSAAFWHG